jgi:hypothetical protein
MIIEFLYEIAKIAFYVAVGGVLLAVAVFGKWWKKGKQ